MAAKLDQCPQGHLFDSAKHTTCPWCGVGADLRAGDAGEGKTRRVQHSGNAPAGAPKPAPTPEPQPISTPAGGAGQGVTRRIAPSRRDVETAGFDPVVGWLVCIEGPDRGRDYRLQTAKNFIGRADGMHVRIAGDDSVSREKHAVVVFEPEETKFWLLPGDSASLVYQNDKVVHTPGELAEGDIIRVGQTKLMFVPFCGERRQW